MNFERLQNLAKALRESKNPDKFDMTCIVHPCGTAACAFGHYADRTDLQSEFKLKVPRDWEPGLGVIDNRGRSVVYNCGKTRAHFGLTEYGIEDIFAPGGCGEAKTPNEAADYIENLVREQAAEELVKETEILGLYDKVYTDGR